MSEWADASLRWQGGALLLALLPLLALLIQAVYRRTHPRPTLRRHLLLVLLRLSAAGLVLLVLAEPVLHAWQRRVARPLVILLADTSPSMATAEPDSTRLSRVHSVLSSAAWREGLALAEVQAWQFGVEASPVPLDSIASQGTAGSATNVAAALSASLERAAGSGNLRAVVLLSDGAHNLGDDPVRVAARAGVPVYSLCVGTREAPPDVQVMRADVAPMGYVGQRLPVTAAVRSVGLGNRQVEVVLYDGEAQVARVPLQLGSGAVEQSVTLHSVPDSPGPHVYRVIVPPVLGESLAENNEATALVEVRRERAHLLVLAGGPSEDVAFARRALQADSSMALDMRVQKDGRAFYDGTELGQLPLQAAQVVVLLDPGAELLGGPFAAALARHVEGGAGLLVVPGPLTLAHWKPDGPLAALLPVQLQMPAAFVARDLPLHLGPEGGLHPVVRPPLGEADPWMPLPPLPGYVAVAQRRTGSSVLVEGAADPRPPVVVAGSAGRGKVLAVLSSSLWRLDLMATGAGGRPQTARTFWQSAVRWLAVSQPVGRVHAYTERQVYRAGEQVILVAQVNDELGRPQPGAGVEAALAGAEGASALVDQGNGRYEGRWSGASVGEHRYTVTARLGGAVVGSDEGRFIVERRSVEAADVRADPELLAEMARVSGGRSRPLQQWRDLVGELPLQQRVTEEERAVSLWGHAWPLIAVVLLLATEWTLRKRGGMI